MKKSIYKSCLLTIFSKNIFITVLLQINYLLTYTRKPRFKYMPGRSVDNNYF